jgi:hypothetical protein
MNSSFNSHRRALLAAALAMPGACMAMTSEATAEHVPPNFKTVEAFTVSTWRQLLTKGPRPAAYVFTNTFCATCPEVFELLQETLADAGPKAKPVLLAAIMMDAQGDRALAHARHYVGATRLYAFDGFEPAIRQAVDPKWRNVTPYVVLVGRGGATQRMTGPPSAKQLKDWLA